MAAETDTYRTQAEDAKRRIDFIQDIGLGRTLASAPPSSARENAAVKDAPRHDDQLEAGIEDSFPASDPPAVTQPARPPKDAKAAADDHLPDAVPEEACPAQEASLDESLEDSFPASDPPSMTAPPGEMVGRPDKPKVPPHERRVADFLKPPA